MKALDVVQRLYAAFSTRDRTVILGVLHPDVEWVQNDGFPGGGRHVGSTHVLDNVLSQFRREWEDFGAHVAEWIEDSAGECVIAIGEYRGRNLRSGRTVRAAFAHVYEVDAGRVVRFRQFTDTAEFRRAME